jgi:hypothetical protein
MSDGSTSDTKRFPPESECQLCRLLDYRGDEINDHNGICTIAREDGGTKIIRCCKRCADELFGTHDWTSYEDLDDCDVQPGADRSTEGSQ